MPIPSFLLFGPAHDPFCCSVRIPSRMAISRNRRGNYLSNMGGDPWRASGIRSRIGKHWKMKMKMMKTKSVLYIIWLVIAVNCRADLTADLNNLWAEHNATNILLFVENCAVTNRNGATLFARGIVAGTLQNWGRGATNCLSQSIIEITGSTNYTEEVKSRLSKEILMYKSAFTALLESMNEQVDSQPTWSTNIHSRVFQETGTEFPFVWVIQQLDSEAMNVN